MSKRGGEVSNDADRSMTLAVLSAKVTKGRRKYLGYIHLHVKTGNGYEKTFEAETPSALPNRAADGALARAVVLMLSDENIISYLSK